MRRRSRRIARRASATGAIKDIVRPAAGRRLAIAATVYGPMAEVVYNSLQYLTDEDVEAMAVYLKALPQARRRAAADEPGAARQPDVMETRPQGLRDAVRDVPWRRRQGPSAAVSAARRQPVDHDVVAGQLDPHGAQRRLSAGHAGRIRGRTACRRSAHILNDDEVAAVVTYIRVAWDNTRHAGDARASRASCARSLPE